jgi:hypothetical protein
MPWLPSPEFAERMRATPPPPFDKWRPWQCKLFACGAFLIWFAFVGAASICVAVIWQLPECHDPLFGPFNSLCHTNSGIGLCVFVLVALFFLYLKYFSLMCQLAYIRTSTYGIDED